jgi:predicted AlkP superfamily pyrophosphatase or phosphodiesterase
MRGLLSLAFLSLASAAVVRRGDDEHNDDNTPKFKHVAVFSVDGLHNSDLDKYLARGASNFTKLLDHSYRWTDAYTTFPSDSFPG